MLVSASMSCEVNAELHLQDLVNPMKSECVSCELRG